MAYESFNLERALSSSDKAGYYNYILQKKINREFEISSNLKEVILRDTDEGTDTTLTVRLVRPYSSSKNLEIEDDYYQILFPELNYTVYLGNLFIFDNYKWLVVDNDNSVLVKRCNVVLKFTDEPPVTSGIYSVDGLAENKTFTMTKYGRIAEKSYTNLPDGEMMVRIPYNSYSRLIKVGTRFLLGEPLQSWTVQNIDSITYMREDIYSNKKNGYLAMKLKLSNDTSVNDDLINRVAYQDYF
jgi:hypothetical protein